MLSPPVLAVLLIFSWWWFVYLSWLQVRECLDAPSRTVLNRAFETVDRVVRDTTIDPFIVSPDFHFDDLGQDPTKI